MNKKRNVFGGYAGKDIYRTPPTTNRKPGVPQNQARTVYGGVAFNPDRKFTASGVYGPAVKLPRSIWR